MTNTCIIERYHASPNIMFIVKKIHLMVENEHGQNNIA